MLILHLFLKEKRIGAGVVGNHVGNIVAVKTVATKMNNSQAVFETDSLQVAMVVNAN